MRPEDEARHTHAGFSGLRNTVPPTRFDLPDLVAAANVDMDDSGAVKRRLGFGDPVLTGSWHSLWSNGARCFAVTGVALHEIASSYESTALANVTPDVEMSWLPSGARAYWSNGYESGCIEDANRSWGLVVPPRIAGTAIGGSLRAGRYQVAMTYLRNDRQESGAPNSTVLDLTDGSGIQFAALPVSADPTVDRKAIYLSEPNGERLYRALVVPNAATTAIYGGRNQLTLPLATQFLSPPPAGTPLAFYGGCALVAVRNLLYRSEPFALELFDRRKSLVFPSTVTMLAPVDGGVFVGTETQHFWLAGNEPSAFVMNNRVASAAIRGTLTYAPMSLFGKSDDETPVPLWHTSEGIVRGSPGGAISNLTRDRFFFPVQERGTSIVRTSRGMSQFLTVLQGAETAAPAA